MICLIMKILKYGQWILVVSFLLPLSCIKMEDDCQEQSPEPAWNIRIEAQKSEEETRALYLSGNTLNAVWTEGDVVTVTRDAEVVGTLIAQYGGASTLLEGTLSTELVPEDELTLTFLQGDYHAQDGTLEYIASHCDYAIATVTVNAVSDGIVTTSKAVFKNQQAINEFNFTINGTAAQVSKLKIYHKAYEFLLVPPSSPQSKFFVAINSDWNDTKMYYFSAEVGGQLYVGKGKVSLLNGKYYKASVRLNKPSYPEPEKIDLGLSVKWASMNLGAAEEYELGYFYAWGETAPKMEYQIQNYIWCDGTSDANRNMLRILKYNKNSNYGAVDNKISLDDADDAAKVNLGGLWRMPTQEEVVELLNNTSWTREVNGSSLVKGYRVTSKINGNSIFFPIIGDMSYGWYWTSSLHVDSSYNSASQCAEMLQMDYRHLTPSDFWEGMVLLQTFGSRYNANGIRPVYDDNATRVTSVSITSSIQQTTPGGFIDFQASVYPTNAANKAVYWSSSDESVATVNQEGRVFAIRPGTVTITVRTMDGNKTDTKTVTIAEVAYDTPGIVDLGLSVKWTTFNLGASAPEEYGEYFAWGELAPKRNTYGSYAYFESNYKWNKYLGGTYLYTKYCLRSEDGFVDNIPILGPDDDAATYHFDLMRIPTKAEWTELKNNCTWEWMELSGVNGVKITSNKPGFTDKWIFLPAAGEKAYESGGQGSNCRYWASDLYSTKSAYYLFYSGSSGASVSSIYRYHGLPIRPVIDPLGYIPVTSIDLDKDELSLSVGEVESIAPTVSPMDASFRKITWTSSNPSVATVDDSGSVTAIAMGSSIITASTPEMDANCTVVVDMVDLGLSVLWASNNLGSENEFYAWGETEPKTSFTKDNYKWYDENYLMTKYCSNPEFGVVDYKSVLDPEDDAAYVQSDGRLRIPTNEEWMELRENCDWVWNGEDAGYYVYGRGDKYMNRRIFIPATGFDDGYGIGEVAEYWSSSVNVGSTDSYCLFTLYFTNERINLFGLRKPYYGCSIRPVSN